MWMYSVGKVLMQLPMRMIYRMTVSGREHIPPKNEKGFILAANHISNIDPIMLGLIMKQQLYFMAKEELFENQFVGWVLHHIGAFSVARGKGDMQAVNYAEDIIKADRTLGIFPEGTRSKSGELLKAKSGVILIAGSTGGDILPACITAFPNKPFRRKHVHIAFGEMIENEKLGLTGTKNLAQIKAASKMLMADIANLRQETLSMEGAGGKDET